MRRGLALFFLIAACTTCTSDAARVKQNTFKEVAAELVAQWHGRNDCDDHIAGDGGATCKGRAQWVMENRGKSQIDAQRQIAGEFPKECGCYVDDCHDRAAGGGATCNSRVQKLLVSLGKSQEDAKKQIAKEFPRECSCLLENKPGESPAFTPDLGDVEGKDDALINEYYDGSMGIAVTMVNEQGWKSGLWGMVDSPTQYVEQLQTFVSIMTDKHPMRVYLDMPYGLALHITESSNFWRHTQVIGKLASHQQKKGGPLIGDIVGGPGDGGSQTAPLADWRLQSESQGKSYEWFKSQKDRILAKYNTVYGRDDYNEFILNGLPTSAVAGIFRFTEALSHYYRPSDERMCFLLRRVHRGGGKWPIYAYSRKPAKLRIERYLNCN